MPHKLLAYERRKRLADALPSYATGGGIFSSIMTLSMPRFLKASKPQRFRQVHVTPK